MCVLRWKHMRSLVYLSFIIWSVSIILNFNTYNASAVIKQEWDNVSISTCWPMLFLCIRFWFCRAVFLRRKLFVRVHISQIFALGYFRHKPAFTSKRIRWDKIFFLLTVTLIITLLCTHSAVNSTQPFDLFSRTTTDFIIARQAFVIVPAFVAWTPISKGWRQGYLVAK